MPQKSVKTKTQSAVALFAEGESYKVHANDEPVRFTVKKTLALIKAGYQLVETSKGSFVFASYDPEKPDLNSERHTSVRVYKNKLGFVDFFGSGADVHATELLKQLGEDTEKYWKEV